MKVNYFLFYFLLICGWNAFAQQIRMVSSDPENLIIRNTSDTYSSVKKAYGGVLYEDFSAVTNIKMMQKDAPALPVFSESLIIPDSGAVSFEILYGEYEEFDEINVLPSKGSLKRNVNPDHIPYVSGPAYSTDSFFPGKLAETGNPYIFRNTRGITITFYPYQYNPISKKLRVYKDISVKLTTDKTQPGANENQQSALPKNDPYQPIYKSHYLNALDYMPLHEAGEMLIIAPAAYNSAIAPLVNWKIESGIKTTVVSLASIGNTSSTIKNYIANFYLSNPGLAYVVLVGDHENLTTYSYGTSGGETLWSDSYYGQLEGTDFYPELMVGRLSGNITDVQRMVTKTINYETEPESGNWMTKAIGIGSNEGYGYGDDEEADWQHLRNIGTKLLSSGYTNIYEFYDASQGGNDANGNPNASMITTAINAGAGLLNYTGHGALDIMSTGNYTSSHVAGLTNSGRYPFVVSVACNNGTFAGGTSICEAFLKASHNNVPTGAIASCGSSILMAWAEPMQTQDEMTELIIQSDPDNIKKSLGGLFYNGQISMLEAYDQSYTAEEVMQTWIFFGDPSIAFRSAVTHNITASHENAISNSGGVLNIYSNTDAAKIIVSQENQILATSIIEGGTAAVAIPALTSAQPLKVTLTKSNSAPYRGNVNVTGNLSTATFGDQFVVYPNPATDVIFIRHNGKVLGNATIRIVDSNGRILMEQNSVDLTASHAISLPMLSAGVYLLSIDCEAGNKTMKIAIR